MGRLSGTRRVTLAGIGVAFASTGGCLGVAGRRSRREPVTVLAAGSLFDAYEHGLRGAVDPQLRVEAYGSVRVARLVAGGEKAPDVVSLADVALFDRPLDADWYVEFATNAVVLAYDPDTEGGRRVAAAGPEAWYRPLLDGEVRLGRTDPALDPLGYRTLFTLELASDYYDTDADLRSAIPAPDQRYPETQLLGRFETGGLDAAFTYRSMAVEHGYEFVDLPARIDLSDPTYADAYATAEYTLPNGRTVVGRPISYGTTVPEGRLRPAVNRVVDAHGTDFLTDYGFAIPAAYPRATGDVPAAIEG